MSNPDHSENKNSASKSDNNPDSTKFEKIISENQEFQQDKIDSIKAFKKKPTRPGTLKKD